MEVEIKTVKAVQCQSLSGLTMLTYEFGVGAESEVFIRIASSTGNGMFSNGWVSFREVLNVLSLPLNQESISSMAFRPLYLGRSINSPSFLMAALRNEEVVVVHPSRKRAYQVFSVSAFEERIDALRLACLIEAPQGEPMSNAPEKKPSRKAGNKKP